MRRIAIIGCGGSGKTTLAQGLGRTVGLPVHHLDRLYWKAGWTETPRTEWREIQQALCEQSAWIIDGNYGGTMDTRLAAADTIIFLDLPARSCFLGALRRYFKYRKQTRPELSRGCPERLTGDYLGWIWSYRETRRPGILRKLRGLQSTKRIVILTSRGAARRFLSELRTRVRETDRSAAPARAS